MVYTAVVIGIVASEIKVEVPDGGVRQAGRQAGGQAGKQEQAGGKGWPPYISSQLDIFHVYTINNESPLLSSISIPPM
jgi:hypothetical protein